MNALAGRFAVGGKEMEIVAGRDKVLQRVAEGWPDEPSPLVRLAAIANGLDEGLDERFARAPERLSECLRRVPWTVTPDEAGTLKLATLVRLEQIEYESFSPDFGGLDMVLRDALSPGEDLSTIASMVRWESLARRAVRTPDLLLRQWAVEVSWLGRQSPSALNESRGAEDAEYRNALDTRQALQRFVSALSWAGQAEWRGHIEPVDALFREQTERQDVPLALSSDARPGAWWDYRLPVGVAESPLWRIWPIEPTRYVAGRHGGGLRTISHVWELATRPCGLRAMTEQELARWADLCSFQVKAISAVNPNRAKGWWADQHEQAQSERRRRSGRDEQERN